MKRTIWVALVFTLAALWVSGCGTSTAPPASGGGDGGKPSDMKGGGDGAADAAVTDAGAAADAVTDAGSDTGALADTVADADTDTGTDAGTDTVTDADTDTVTDAGTDADTDTVTDADTDTVTDADTDTVTDADTDTVADADTDTVTDAGPDAGPAPDANPKADAGPPANIVCGGAEPKFPAFSKACVADTDCGAALHQVNCCGTQIAVGVAKTDLAAFKANEAICNAQYPACGCASWVTITEDGKPVSLLSDVVPKCVDGVCLSTVPTQPDDCKKVPGGAPQPFKWCQADADCDTMLHMTDCCGSQVAWGVSKAAKVLLQKTELACNANEPICDCAPKPTTAEDNQLVTAGALVAKCQAGMCSSWVKK